MQNKNNKKIYYTYEIDYARKSKLLNLELINQEFQESKNSESKIISLNKNLDEPLKNQLLNKLANTNYSIPTNKLFLGGENSEQLIDETIDDNVDFEELENLYVEDVKKDTNLEKTKTELMKVTKITKKKIY